MAVYNVASYVAESLHSALGQTLPDLELIVADDGSTDETAEEVARAADHRCRVLRLPHVGVAAALNSAVAQARGRYLAFLDGDDLWDAAKLERHVAFMAVRPGVDLTFSRSRTIDEKGRALGLVSRRWRGPLPFERLLVDNFIVSGSATVVRCEALRAARPFDTSLAAGQDVDMWLRIARQRPDNVHGIPEVLVSYRRRPGQITRDWRLMESCLRRVLRQHSAGCGARTAGLERAALCNLYRYLAMLNYEAGHAGQGLRLLARSLLASPRAFAKSQRSYLVAGALGARALLPGPCFRALERVVRRC